MVATAFAVTTLKLDVTGFTPASTPRVLDEPVVDIVSDDVLLVTESNDEHTVVKRRTARQIINSSDVELPWSSVDSDGERSVGNQVGSDLGFVGGNHGVVGDLGSDVGTVKRASSINCLVRVAGFSVNSSVGHDVSESVRLETTLAARVARLRAVVSHAFVITIDQVLFGKTSQSVAGQKPLSFNVTSGRESPARTALTLVLNRSNSSFGSPVERVWESGEYVFVVFIGDWDGRVTNSRGRRQVKLFEFTWSQIGEMSGTESSGLGSSVEGIDDF